MFGYVSANPKLMTEQEAQRYRGAYCGLCRCLGQCHGQLTRLSLTYDMTFLALFLGAMYEPEEREELFWCVVHPKEKHTSVITEYTQYAADMNVLMAYLNCVDNWKDDRNIVALLESFVFKLGYEKALKKYPRQAAAICRELEELSKLEAAKCDDPDLPANCFGRLLGEVFVVNEQDYFAKDLWNFGFFLGKFIYLYDAIMDFDADKQCGSYNPILEKFGDNLTEIEARQMLTFYISECVRIYERLPIVQDGVIIKNILYSGVWQAFQKKFGCDGNGSIEHERPL